MADGYGNRRVIVFDADTGAFKRMWGAFGNMPTDGAPNLAQADAGADGSPQFIQPVHAARVSNDGLVYVSDRGGKRVQVFTIDGKFVSQVFIGRECKAPDCGNGTTAASTAFSPDAAQRFLYVGNRSQAKVMVFDRKTLGLLDSFGRWGSAPGRVRHAASHGGGFEGQPLRHRGHAAEAREPAGAEVHLHGHDRCRHRRRAAPRSDLAVISATARAPVPPTSPSPTRTAPRSTRATVHVRIRYGFMSLKRMDLEVGTNSDGKARVEGLPEKARPLVYDITKDGRHGNGRARISQRRAREATRSR